MIDSDKTSSSYGLADRYHWAWGLIDFSNGTFQGMAHGFCRLWANGLWPYDTSKHQFKERIDSLFLGTKKIINKNGSLEESFPNEGSFCVTALVAFDLLCSVDLINDEIDIKEKDKWLGVIEPMIDFLKKSDEKHAMISNHLATATAALVRWNDFTNDDKAASVSRKFLDRILTNQSKEGWFDEYGGADPGYQSLCTYYLSDIHQLRPNWKLLSPLKKSIKFLSYFAHPDGSFGGHYGSRSTRFYYPAGIDFLSDQIFEASQLSRFMAKSILNQNVVSLSSIDEPNLVPTFNSYCWSAVLHTHKNSIDSKSIELPALNNKPFRKFFPESGLVVDKGQNHYSVISTKKGGIVYHFIKNKKIITNTGIVVKNSKGKLGCNHSNVKLNEVDIDNEIIISSKIVSMPKQLPKPWQFILLRILSLTLFRSVFLREIIKKLLVRLLITNQKKWPIESTRRIYLGENLYIKDELDENSNYQIINKIKVFVPIHMASQGYWQVQDEAEL